MTKEKISLFWFRRDLRLEDNRGLHEALKGKFPVLPIFIVDENITAELDENDPRITFIYDSLQKISAKLTTHASALWCKKGDPDTLWQALLDQFNIQEVYTNEDYEPYAIQRDSNIAKLLHSNAIAFKQYKDHVIFAKNDILKNDNSPYTVFTPFKNKWISTLENDKTVLNPYPTDTANFVKITFPFPTLEELEYTRASQQVRNYQLDELLDYEDVRNFPSLDKTSYLSPHLRFGTVSIRTIINLSLSNQAFLSELIWREFFMQILYHFPHSVYANFKSTYDTIVWRNNAEEFEKWTTGQTGYPLVDAGMRELNTTGYMHNRVRMVVAGFLCKHLLIDWRWGEAYFAKKLLDFELASNVGNWQWAAGTGCDAAPYFRIFNPTEQLKKFDPKLIYTTKWVPELNSFSYPPPMVDHKKARERAIETYMKGLQEYTPKY
jgi:deoxyribodipyrimidine photo-lyase